MSTKPEYQANLNDPANLPLHPKYSETSLNNMNRVPNIPPDEDGFHSEGESSGNNNDHGLSPRRDRRLVEYRHKTVCVMTIVAIVVSVIAVILAVAAIVMYKEAAHELKMARESRETVCFPCDEKAIQRSSWKQGRVPGECCVKLEEVLDLMKQIVKDRVDTMIENEKEAMSSMYRSVISSSSGSANTSLVKRISAHLVLEPLSSLSDSDPIPWTVSDVGHLEGLTLENDGSVRAQQSGYYFIYAQLKYFERDWKTSERILCTIQVVTNKDNLKQVVLENANLKWDVAASRTYTIQTAAVSGVVYLQSGSSVSIASDEPRLIKPEKTSCYFGIYRL